MTGFMHHTLSGEWQLRQAESEEWLPGSAPGGVHTDLLAAGRIADPFVGDEEKRVQWVAERDWEYRRVVHVAADLLERRHLFLVCDGLDTLADVWLNGQQLGSAENMFRQYRWDVRDALRAGENELRIVFRSAAGYAAERARERPMREVNDSLPGAPYLRKAPSHFGWDWGPKLPAIGIWRDLRLAGYTIARLDDLHLRQRHADEQVTLAATVTAERWEQAPLRVTLRLTAPDGQVQTADAALDADRKTIEMAVERPQLWWPNGYGAQPLYDVEVELSSDETILDRRTCRIGLRTIELRQQPDDWGRSFTFVVNGQPIFAKGTNWIPADSFPTRVSHAQLDHLIGSAVAAHHNMLRIWGGGYYEDDYLYDLCDRLGVLVWQDFMFACSTYPLDDPALLENVRIEVVENMRRLRYHACLALWCGNNEIETAWVDWGWDVPELADLKAAYDRFFHHTLPAWVAAEDPDLAYWPSSPSSGMAFQNPNGGAVGDMHEWTVWHAMMPLGHYRAITARFVSEFGFQSLPSLRTIATYAEPSEWNMTSYIMEHHQRNPAGNGKIVTYLTAHLRLPKDFDSLVYLSQVLQAEAMRIGVEHWRRDPACSGVLYWQLNDCWPVASWSSIDYIGRWKAAHYASRRFYAPLLLSIEDQQEHMGLFVTSDAAEPWAGKIRWSLETLGGERLDEGAVDVRVAPHSTSHVQTLDFAGRIGDEHRRQTILVCELWQGDERTHMAIGTFAPTKHLALEDPQIEVEVRQDSGQLTVRLQARALARFVELLLDGVDVVLSDNYFDLPAGRPVSVTCPLPAGWTIEQARQRLRVRSVFDSYDHGSRPGIGE
ncbi:MAG TPA: glycoside hydrolase family 2 protein [Herpetosiphonaceae bacterium]